MKFSNDWQEYELLDSGNEEKLERWGKYILKRPDPMAIWKQSETDIYNKVDAYYTRSNKGGGKWTIVNKIPDSWIINYKDLKFKISLTNFKHTGLFPEQAYNWDLIEKVIKNKKDIKVLNLFAYTGAATMAASKAGASEVVHVDASKGIISWAKENMVINNLTNNKIRFIEEDCIKFMLRELRRGRKYDLIILDPPSYGRGNNNELFKFEEKINFLLEMCKELLSDNYIGVILNSYTTGYSSIVLKNVMSHHFKDLKGEIESNELCIPFKDKFLPCGLTTSFIRYD